MSKHHTFTYTGETHLGLRMCDVCHEAEHLHTAAPDQGNRTSELDDILDPIFSDLESAEIAVIGEFSTSIATDTKVAKEDIIAAKKEAKAALQRLVSQEVARLAGEVIGVDEAPKPKPRSKDVHERLGTCWICYEQDYCTHEIRDELRAEQRRRLDALQGGTKE